jgi:hypothetical protein
MTDSIYAITVWQPWATLIAEGLKPFEFRSWPAPARLIGQRIAIHAGARPMRIQELADLRNQLATSEWRTTGLAEQGRSLDVLDTVWRAWGTKPTSLLLPHSHVVCTAILSIPVRDDVLAARLGLPLVADSDREEHSNWGWPLTDIERLEPPVPARGAQGIWRWMS